MRYFLQAGWPSCRPTTSVKTLPGYKVSLYYLSTIVGISILIAENLTRATLVLILCNLPLSHWRPCSMMFDCRLASETFHFACLLTAATALPCMCVIGPSLGTWIYIWTWEGYVDSRHFSTVINNSRQVANRHCAQANSAGWKMSQNLPVIGLWGEGLMRLTLR